jgi:hypothetical protein
MCRAFVSTTENSWSEQDGAAKVSNEGHGFARCLLSKPINPGPHLTDLFICLLSTCCSMLYARVRRATATSPQRTWTFQDQALIQDDHSFVVLSLSPIKQINLIAQACRIYDRCGVNKCILRLSAPLAGKTLCTVYIQCSRAPQSAKRTRTIPVSTENRHR